MPFQLSESLTLPTKLVLIKRYWANARRLITSSAVQLGSCVTVRFADRFVNASKGFG